MTKIRKKLALTLTLMFLLANFSGFIHSSAAVKKPVIPQIKFVKTPSTTYTAGDRVKFDIYAPNCSSTVEYRVVLWDGNKKTYSDLWNSSNGCPTHYYTKWRPNGRTTFKLGWNINEPGSYRITVYVKRVGIAPSKAYLSKYNCDSYMQSAAFTVKPKVLTLNKEGSTYGSADPKKLQSVNANVNITAKNITYSNANIHGDVYLLADNITLKNVNITGTLFLNPGIDSSFNLDGVHAGKIDVKSLKDSTYEFKNITANTLLIDTKNTIAFKAGSGASIQNTIINESADIENAEGSFGNVTLSGSTATPVTVNVKGTFAKPIVIEKSAILKNNNNPVNVRILPAKNEEITATLEGSYGSVDILKDSIVNINSNSYIKNLTSYDYAEVYADESSTIESIKNGSEESYLYICGKVKYTSEEGAFFVTDNSVLPTSSEIAGNTKAQLYYYVEENSIDKGIEARPTLKMKLFKEDGSPLNITKGRKIFIDSGEEVLSYKFYPEDDSYKLPVNTDDGTIRIHGGNYKVYVPVEGDKWYVLSYTANQLSTTGKYRSEITSVNETPYNFTRWAVAKYSVLYNGANKPYITIGSKLSDVIRVLGKPTSVSSDEGYYDCIYFYQKDASGRFSSSVENYIQLVMINGTYTVVGWQNNGTMKVQLEAASSTAPPIKVGSTMEEVAKAMGTPIIADHYFDEDEWVYNHFDIYFIDGRVTRWEII